MKKLSILIIGIFLLSGCSNTNSEKTNLYPTVHFMGEKWDICFDNCRTLKDDIAECLEICIEENTNYWSDKYFKCESKRLN